jgi:hypothetical protein
MRHIKTYEELKPETYLSAADKLSKLGHVKRPENLKKWADDAKRRNLISIIKSIGQFDIEIGEGSYDSVIYNNTKKVGKFYIYLYLDKDGLESQIEDWKENHGRCWLPLDLGFLPVDEESENTLKRFSSVHYNTKMGIYFVNRIWINITLPYKNITDPQLYQFGVKKPIDVEDLKGQIFPSGDINISDDTHEVTTTFVNRANALKFKRALINIFEGYVDYMATSENPGGLKEEITDIFYDEYGFTTEEILRFINSIKKMKVNNFYKD